MIRFTQQEMNTILADLLGKPYARGETGPDAYDCYGLVKSFMGRIGVQIADIGKADPGDSRPIYEQQQTDYIRLSWPRPWSMVTFCGRDLNAHIGVVLPGDGLFLHCPGRAAGKVIAEPLGRRPWRDTVEGYWWPRGYIETVILLTPMTMTKRAWQFVRSGRTLAAIIEQDITEGRDVPVQVFLDGQPIEKEDWICTVPTELQQIVVRPRMGEGEQALMAVGMVALAVLAPYALAGMAGSPAGVAAASAAGTTVSVGSTFAYNLATASVMMAGGMALNALIGPSEADRESSQHYTWNPQTTQRVGALVPLVYGTYGVRGNILCAYATSEHTWQPTLFAKSMQIRFSTELYHLKIAYSDGPIGGVVEGSEQINDRSPEYYSESPSFTVEHFTGTDDQAASSIPDAFEVPVGLDCPTNEPATTIFTAVDCDDAALVLRFPNGFTDYEKDGGHKTTTVTIKAEIRIAEGAWHTLMNGDVSGDTRNPLRYNLELGGTYTGGAPFTLVAAARYEARVTRLSNTHSDKGENFLFECVQFRYATVQKLPGMAYTAIGAAASRDISGSIQYSATIQGKLVCIYNAAGEVVGIEWSDNPAWVGADLLTRPVIRGNGTTVPYAVEYYRRLNPSYLAMADFITLASWCDEWVPNGNGGAEKRYVFNGVFDADGSAWDQAIRVFKMACSMPFFKGHRVGIVIDKPATPSQMFNVSNLRSGFVETWLDNSEAATVYDVEFADELADYAMESYPVPLLGASQDIPASLDGFGHTKRSQVWRAASRQLRINQHMRRTVEIPACLDAIWSGIGDIVYVQHPALNRATGGRIVEVYSDGVKLDKPVTMGTGDHALLVRTHDGTAERLSLYEALSVTGTASDIVTISGIWEYTPNVNDLWTFGQEVKVVDLYRIKGFERTRDGQVFIQGTQYTTDYYDDDDAAPHIQSQVYSTNRGGRSPTLLPTTAEAIRISLPDGNSHLDSLVWEGLVFTGDSLTTVTWTCQSTGGAGIKYQGTWCPIFDDAVGTTDRYIYFDPAAGDPRYLLHTHDIGVLAGRERYVFCVNEQGVPYLKPGLLVGADEVKLDGIEAGATAGATWGVNIADQPDGYLIQWQGASASHPANPQEGWAYRNSADGKSYIYHDLAWYQMTADGVAGANGVNGADGLSIVWKGNLASPPASPVQNWAYRDTDDGIVYIYNGSAWGPMVYDGSDGAAGAEGSDGTNGLSVFITYHDNPAAATPATPAGDGTTGGWHTAATVAAVWISQKVAEAAGSGAWGSPIRIKGTDGQNGLSVVWKGDLASAPANPVVNWAYRNTGNGYAYIYNGSAWVLMVRDGSNGIAGTNGANGLSVFVTYHDSPPDTVPAAPTGNGTTGGWHTTVTSSVVWISQKVAADASSGTWGTPLRISGTAVWSEVINDGGKPETGADVTKSSVIANSQFFENFDDPFGTTLARWPKETGSGTFSLQTGGLAGNKVLRIVAPDAAAETAHYCRHATWLPFDPSKLYRVRFRVRSVVTGRVYLGVAARNTADTGWLNFDGTTAWGGHWFVALNELVPAAWTVYTGYLKGHAAPGVNGTAEVRSNPGNPAVLRAGTGYIHPFVIAITVNGQGVQTGIEIDEVSIDIMPDGGAVCTEAIALGSVVNYGAAYTDATALLNTASGEVDMQSLTITTSGLPVVIQYGATIQYYSAASSAVLRLYRVGAGDMLQAATIIKAEAGDDKGYFSAFIHTPAAGSHTYKFTSTGGANHILVGKRFLSVTEFKR